MTLAWSNLAGDWSFYMDGIEVDSGTGHQVGTTINADGVLIFGKDQDTKGGGHVTHEGFSGTFYDTRLFDDVRTPSEVASGTNATLPPSSPNMIANWQFGADGSDDIVDVVSGNDLILNQAVGSGFTPSTPIAMVGLSEAAAVGTVVATLTASDVDAGDSHTFSITSDPSGFFEIIGNELRVAAGASLDYDVQEVHLVTVEAQDSGGLTTSQVFNIDLLNEVTNLAPTDLDAIGRNGTSINHDGGNAAYYSPVDSSGLFGGMTTLTVEAQFAVQDYSGLTDLPMLNYLNGSSDQFDFRIVNPNGSPQIRARIDGQSALPSWDASPLLDGNIHTISFAWTSFGGVWEMYIDGVRLDNGTGLANGSSLDFGGNLVIGIDQDTAGGSFETDQVFTGTYYDVRIFDDVRTATEIALNAGESVDPGEANLVANWQFGEGGSSPIVDVVGGNNLILGQASGGGFNTSTPQSTLGVFQNAPDGSFVASLSALDPNFNETFTYAITSDPSGFFEINGDQLVVAGGASMDFATDPFHTITVEVTDEGGLTYSEAVTIAVLNDSGFVGGTPNQIIGTPNPDALIGTIEGEFIFGLGDDDVIDGGGGNDLIRGQDGADTIYGGGGDDVIFADRESQATDLVEISQHIINSETAGNQSGPSVVALADGRTMVAWYDQAQENNDHQSRVQVQFVNPDGSLDGSQQELDNIEVEGNDAQDMPMITTTVLATGDVLVTWVTESQHSEDGDVEAVYGVVVDSTTNTGGLPFQINTTSSGPQSGASVTAMDDGRALVVWYDEAREGGTNAQVHGRIVNPDGTVTTPEFDIGSYGVTGVDWVDMPPLTSVALATGSVYVSWASFGDDNVDGSGSAVIGVLVNPATGISGEETIVNDTTIGHQSPPVAVALDDGGVFLVYYGNAWNDNDSGMTLKGRFVDAGGDLDGPEISIGTAYVEGDDNYDMPPLTAVRNADGNILVSWLEDNSLGSDIVANLVNASTHTVGPNLQISDPTGFKLSGPVLVALGDGRILTTWYERADFNDVSGMVVKARILNSDGSPSGSELEIGTYPVEGDNAIDMPPLTATMMFDGNVMISWESDDWKDVLGGGNGSEVVSVIVKTKTTAGADIVSGEGGNDIITGGDGDDWIDGGSGSDSLDGGDGVDIVSFLSASSGVTALFEDSDASGIDGSFTNATAGGKTGDASGDTYAGFERIEGSDFDDAIYADGSGMSATLGYGDDLYDNDSTSTGIDTVLGGFGSDTIRTGGGADYLSGGPGNDSLFGEDGDDTLEGGAGADLLNGGSGFDTASYANAAAGVDVLMSATDAFGIDGAYTSTAAGGQAGEGAGDSLISIERVIGSDHGDRVYGNDSGTTADLGAGDDIFDNDATQYVIDDVSGGDGNDLIRTGDGDDIITGNQGNDDLRGEGGDDTISGGDDSDLIAGGAGDDIADGGADTDTYYANGFRADFTLIDNLDGTYTLRDDRPGSPEGTDLLTNIELIEYWDQTDGVNNPLSLDLDQSSSGSGYTTSFVENAAIVAIADTDVIASDPEDSISRIIINISNMVDGSDDQLTVNASTFSLDADASGISTLGSGLSIAYAYTASSGELIVNHASGSSSPITNAQAQEAIESLAYQNLSENPVELDRELSFVLEDMDANQSPAAISTIAVVGVNDAPVAAPDTTNVLQDSSVVIDVLANDSDIDGILDPATVQITGTANPGDVLIVAGEGSWTINTTTGEITFTPETGFAGTVTDITYTVRDDGGATSNAANVSVSIVPSNTAPTLDLDSTNGSNNFATSFTEDAVPTLIAGLNTVPVDDGDSVANISMTLDAVPDGSLEFLIVNATALSMVSDYSGNTTLGSGLQVAFTYTAATRELVLTNLTGPGDPLTNINTEEILQNLAYLNGAEDPTAGNRTFTFVLEDTGGLTSTPAFATVNVIPVNDAPALDLDTTVGGSNYFTTYNENAPAVKITSTNTLAIDAESAISNVTLNLNAVPDGAAELLTVNSPTFSLASDNAGMTTLGSGLQVSYVYTAATRELVLTNFAGPGDPMTPTNVEELLESLSYRNTSEDPTIANRIFSIVLEDDGGLTSLAADASILINPSNDAPVAVNDVINAPEDTKGGKVVTINDIDVDGTLDPATIQISGTASAGDSLVVPGEGTWSINTSSGTIWFEPEPDFNGSVTAITYTVEDDQGAVSNPATFSYTVTPVNDAPTDIVVTGNAGVAINTDGGDAAYFKPGNSGAILGGLTQFTIETQFSNSNPTTAQHIPIFNYFDGGPTDELEITIFNASTSPYILFELGGDVTSIPSSTYDPSGLLDGGQHTLSFDWDNSSGDWNLYEDGTHVANGSGLNPGHSLSGSGVAVFGQEQDSLEGSFNTGQIFAGTYYDIRIFDDIRTAGEIAGGSNVTLPASEPNMVANWQFGDGEISTVTDVISGNDLNLVQATGPGFTPSTPAGVLSVIENSVSGTVIGTFNTTDVDVGDTFTYTLTSDPSGFFEIMGDELRVKSGANLDYETSTSHSVTIETEDSGGLTYSKSVQIQVTNSVTITGTIGNDSLSGTAGDDEIYGLDGNDVISAGAGNDYIDGGDGNDDIYGESGDDTIVGGIQSDFIEGGAGNDIIDGGGSGNDRAIYSGNRADYIVHDNQDGTYVITDTRPTSPDGTDTIQNVEYLDFADQLVDIASAITATSPIAFDLSGDGKINVTGETTAKDKSDISEIGSTVEFDMDGDDDLETIEWLDGTGDALLVDNRDGLAANDMDGTRLFGDQGGRYEHGYQQLAELDGDKDGVLKGDELTGLELWSDDGDARLEDGELFTLDEIGISQISVTLQKGVVDEGGRDLFRSTATRADGSQITTEDVWFAEDHAIEDEQKTHADLSSLQSPDENLL